MNVDRAPGTWTWRYAVPVRPFTRRTYAEGFLAGWCAASVLATGLLVAYMLVHRSSYPTYAYVACEFNGKRVAVTELMPGAQAWCKVRRPRYAFSAQDQQ